MPTETKSVRKIEIKIDTQGSRELKDLANQFGSLNTKVKGIGASLDGFKNAFIGAFAGIGVREVARLSDEMQSLGARINSIHGGTIDVNGVMQGLTDTANRTKTSVSGLATIYARLAASTKDANLSSSSLLQVTETLQNTFRLSGATTQEATNAAVQLSQGFASGQLRGQELRSVLEQNVEFGDLLTKSLGKTRGELYKLAEQGQLTSGVVLSALVKSMDDVNARADKLGQTFEQTLTVALNNFQKKIFDINKQFDLSGKFAKGIEAATNGIYTLATAITVVLLPAFVSAATTIGAAFTALYATPAGPFLLVLSGVGLAVALIADNFDAVKKAAKESFDFILDLGDKVVLSYHQIILNIKDLTNATEASKEVNREVFRDYFRRKQASEDLFEAEFSRIKKTTNEEITSLYQRKALEDQVAKLGKKKGDLEDRKELLARLNKEFRAGSLSVADYYTQLRRVEELGLEKKFLDGTVDLEKLNDAMRKTKELNLAQEFRDGIISVDQYRDSINQLKIENLNEELLKGKISLTDFNSKLIEIDETFNTRRVFSVGLNNFITSVGTLGSQVAGSIEKAFDGLGDAFFEFTKKGTYDMRIFAQAVLDDLNKIIFRSLVLQPLASGLLNSGLFKTTNQGDYSGGFQSGDYSTVAAKGAIVNGPTSFGYGQGKLGLMGEAGPEAIIPLKRSSNGELGIQAPSTPVMVNIINNTGSQVEQSESTGPGGEKILEIIIGNKVKEGIASGQFDRSMQSAYGLRRRGT